MIIYTLTFTAMHIVSSLFISMSLNYINCDVPEHYYIFVIDSVYCVIRLYETFIIMYTLSMKLINIYNVILLNI